MPLIYHEGYSLGDGAGNNQLLKDTVGWTGKNLIKNGGARTSVVNGVTFVVNDDGSVTVNGTATGEYANFVMLSRSSNSVILDAGQYILTGCPIGGGSGTYRLIAQATRDGALHPYGEDWGSGKTFTAEDGDSLQIVVTITGGQTVNNLTFYPMLRRADIIDDTYEPYHESVEVMYEEEIHGVNLADSSTADIGIAWNGNTNSDRARLVIPCSPNTEYIASINGTNAMSYIGYVTSPTIIPSQTSLIDFVSHVSITTGANDRYIIIGFAKTGITQANVDALKFMLRKADIEDSTYRPYNYQAIQNQLNAQGVLGAKNLLEVTANTQTLSGVTFTVNRDSDGNVINVTVNGTPSSDIYFRINSKFSEVGRYILNGILDGSNTFRMQAYIYASSDNTFKRSYTDTGSGTEVVIDNGEYANFEIIVTQSGGAVNNKKVYPMLRLASDPDDTYQPYAMTNRELTEKKINIADLKTVVSASSDFTDFKTRIASL